MSQTVLKGDPLCLVCGASASVERASRNSIERMAHALRVIEPTGFSDEEVRLATCNCCGLQFSLPMREPGPGFYRFLVHAGFAYPEDRWEWRACVERFARRLEHRDGKLVVVDLGSGGGGFMRLLSSLPRVSVFGLDHNPEVVARCRAEGLDVIEGGLDDLSRRWPEGVDVVTFWHVIEHVDDPVGLLEASRQRLREGGELCFSVPLTPMSYEHSWPDPFNEPPHHLTRWNLRALEALAARLEMRMELNLPKAAPLSLRVLKALVLQAMPPFGITGRSAKVIRLLGFLLRRPLALPREIVRQFRHPRHAGRVLPDVVLVTLRR